MCAKEIQMKFRIQNRDGAFIIQKKGFLFWKDVVCYTITNNPKVCPVHVFRSHEAAEDYLKANVEKIKNKETSKSVQP
jgi:hypothetical protein